MAQVRIFSARLHDKEEIRALEKKVGDALTAHLGEIGVCWLTSAAGGDGRCEFNIIAIITIPQKRGPQ